MLVIRNKTEETQGTDYFQPLAPGKTTEISDDRLAKMIVSDWPHLFEIVKAKKEAPKVEPKPEPEPKVKKTVKKETEKKVTKKSAAKKKSR
jgi:hypothetical protein